MNRSYKDSVFTKCFGTPENALEAYCAVTGRKYPENAKVEMVTLSDALFMEQLNDVAFVIDDKLVVLMEHQSTVNENIPLRMLIYVAREYELITSSKNLYKKKKVKIPTPEFVVLYNGEKEMDDYVEMRLSESFEFESDVNLELVVKAYNINKGRNTDIVSRSRSLSDYGEFIAEVRANCKAMSLKDAAKAAVKSCISRNVFADFLTRHGSEVENMLLTGWNMKEALEVSYEEGVEDGMEKGAVIGETRGETRVLDLMAKGYDYEQIKKILKS
ncbi:MAG: Rpn family recombination-promoting nuclease/putative transposase [Fibromonadales bacterium]|nr:Rpn family recombination-promoting nuclease/putative transposase [Fibromonadales bacterium]